MDKISFNGKIISIQPRIRLLRSFNETSHNYLGFSIRIDGVLNREGGVFCVGIGKAAQAKHEFKVNDEISGSCLPVETPEMEPVEYYKVSKLKKPFDSITDEINPPWHLVPPALEVYRERGCRRLSLKTYESKCSSCMWAAYMPVEIIIDNWNPKGRKKYRYETFCYGPKSCKIYKAGPERKVEGRNGAVYIEEDWVDETAVEHRDD